MLYETGKSALGRLGSFFLLSSRIPCAATRSHRALFVGGGRSPRTHGDDTKLLPATCGGYWRSLALHRRTGGGWRAATEYMGQVVGTLWALGSWEGFSLQQYSLDEKFGDEDNGWDVKANVRTYVKVVVMCLLWLTCGNMYSNIDVCHNRSFLVLIHASSD